MCDFIKSEGLQTPSSNSYFEMNSFDCILVQNGTFSENTICFLDQYFAFVIVLLVESF